MWRISLVERRPGSQSGLPIGRAADYFTIQNSLANAQFNLIAMRRLFDSDMHMIEGRKIRDAPTVQTQC
jgi:hypothetical protein